MLTRRSLVATSLVAAVAPATAATPKDVLVIAKQIDDINSLDPHESFDASGGEIVMLLQQVEVAVTRKGVSGFNLEHIPSQVARE